MIGNAAQRFDTEGNLADETTKDYMRQLLVNLVELIRRVRQPSISAPISDIHTLFATSNTGENDAGIG